MKIFSCSVCGQPVFFDNVRCLHCGSVLSFLPDQLALAAAGDDDRYRPCLNRPVHQACNFAVLSQDPNPLCIACRHTRLLPDLSEPRNHERWRRIERAKRRLFYTLARLGLVATNTTDGAASGPMFEFLADLPGTDPVVTGHDAGVITLNIAEADDDERVRLRVALHEPYRTLLGHLRHESGHYYWDQLIGAGPWLAGFCDVFGDHEQDYAAALDQHYAQGADGPDWQQNHVSAYAAAHPWEDWAETWAHYLHMVDLLETASSYGTRLALPGPVPDDLGAVQDPFCDACRPGFDQLVAQWVPVTLLLNSMNRSLGQDDAYPFALTPGALRKLRFVHDVIVQASHP